MGSRRALWLRSIFTSNLLKMKMIGCNHAARKLVQFGQKQVKKEHGLISPNIFWMQPV